jgi:hypothetical protein
MIAEKQMGGAKDAMILLMHNQQAGILFDPDELYAGVTIEIPENAPMPPVAPDALPTPPAPPA